MYFDYNKFKKMIADELKKTGITPPEPTKEECDNLYKYWLTQETNTLSKFFKSFSFKLIDEITDDNYEYYRQVRDVYTDNEFIEFLIKEKHIYKGAFQLSDDLWIIKN